MAFLARYFLWAFIAIKLRPLLVPYSFSCSFSVLKSHSIRFGVVRKAKKIHFLTSSILQVVYRLAFVKISLLNDVNVFSLYLYNETGHYPIPLISPLPVQ